MLEAFREGQSTADVRKTKLRAIVALIVTPSAMSLYLLIKAYWPEFPFDAEYVAAACTALVSLIGVVSHIISTPKIGFVKADFPDLPQPSEQQRRLNDDRTYGG